MTDPTLRTRKRLGFGCDMAYQYKYVSGEWHKHCDLKSCACKCHRKQKNKGKNLNDYASMA